VSHRVFDVAVIGATRTGWIVAEAACRRGARVALLDHAPDLAAYESIWLSLRSRMLGLWGAAADRESSQGDLCMVAREIFFECIRGFGARPSRQPFAAGITCFAGPVELASDEDLITADRSRIRFRSAVIATGSRPRRPERFFWNGARTSDPISLLQQAVIPRSVVIVGADWFGCEWAFVLACLGCSVLLVDRRSRLLRSLGSDFRRVVLEQLHSMQVEIVLEEEIARVQPGRHGGVNVDLGSGRSEVTDSLLILAGHVGETRSLGLERLDIALDPFDHVLTDDFGRSSIPSILAIGSVADPSGLFPVPMSQAEILAGNALGASEPLETDLPWILNVHPQIGVCGLTSELCSRLDMPVAIGNVGSVSGRSDESSLARVAADRATGRLLGAEVCGPGAGEGIYLVSNAIGRGETVHDITARACPEASGSEQVWRSCRAIQEQLSGSRPVVALGRIRRG
jgi:pyruvate/2-oxoglutarate dehydrogenase complex dihydrolipoamide dehydrogenase (E3) component